MPLLGFKNGQSVTRASAGMAPAVVTLFGRQKVAGLGKSGRFPIGFGLVLNASEYDTPYILVPGLRRMWWGALVFSLYWKPNAGVGDETLRVDFDVANTADGRVFELATEALDPAAFFQWALAFDAGAAAGGRVRFRAWLDDGTVLLNVDDVNTAGALPGAAADFGDFAALRASLMTDTAGAGIDYAGIANTARAGAGLSAFTPDDADVIRWWRFAEQAGTTAADTKGSGDVFDFAAAMGTDAAQPANFPGALAAPADYEWLGAAGSLDVPSGGGGEPETPAFALSPANMAKSVVQGATVQGDAITLARTNFAGDVTLALSGAPAGITATFTDGTLAGGDTTSTPTFAVASNVAPGVKSFVVRGTAAGGGPAPDDVAVSLTVTAAPVDPDPETGGPTSGVATVRVLDGAGQPVAGRRVVFALGNGRLARRASASGQVGEATTDADGYASASIGSGSVPGATALYAQVDGVSAAQAFTVAAIPDDE